MIQQIIGLIVGLALLAMFTIMLIYNIKNHWTKETTDSSAPESRASHS